LAFQSSREQSLTSLLLPFGSHPINIGCAALWPPDYNSEPIKNLTTIPMRIFPIVAAITLSLAQLEAQTYTVSLDAAQEGGAGTGSGSGTLVLSNNVLNINVTFSGLSALSTVDHIHGPSPLGGPAAGVIYGLQGITTLGATSGTINGNITFANGTAGLTIAQQISQLNSNLWYINIHSTTFPGGEIRGQINLISNVPPVLKNPLVTGGGFKFTLQGIQGQRYATEFSTDLLTWTPISTNTASSNIFDVLDASAAPGDTRFYRAKWNP
jgi:hypothetical protein